MTTTKNTDHYAAPIIQAAEQLLSQRTGGAVQFTHVACITDEERRNRLFRCTVENPPAGLPASLILKQVVAENYQPDDVQAWDTVRFFRDWAGAQFLSSLPGNPDHGPHFYGGDHARGFIILEDLGQEHRSLVEPLLEGNAAGAESALLKYITRLGKMHADTICKGAEYQAFLQAANPALLTAPRKQDQQRQNIDQFCETLTKLDIAHGAELRAELHQIYAKIEQPGDFAAFLHQDPCPDNLFFVGDEARLIDFEFAQFGHALIDASYARIIFPTCWCCNRVPPRVVAKVEAAYRAELVHRCPAAADDQRFAQELGEVCGFWLLQSLQWQLTHALEKDDRWGIASVRSRVLARLEAFITTVAEFDLLPVYRATASQLLERLQVRWPDVERLPFYPAFRS